MLADQLCFLLSDGFEVELAHCNEVGAFLLEFGDLWKSEAYESNTGDAHKNIINWVKQTLREEYRSTEYPDGGLCGVSFFDYCEKDFERMNKCLESLETSGMLTDEASKIIRGCISIALPKGFHFCRNASNS